MCSKKKPIVFYVTLWYCKLYTIVTSAFHCFYLYATLVEAGFSENLLIFWQFCLVPLLHGNKWWLNLPKRGSVPGNCSFLCVSLVFPSGLILLIFFLVPLSAFPLHVPSHRLNKCLPGDHLTRICLRGAIATEWRNLSPWLPRWWPLTQHAFACIH